MAEETAENLITLNDEIEGDRDSTGDFIFVRVGASVPLKPTNSAFDLRNPPSQPIAISQRNRLLFLAHAEGFFVARTDDVVGIANEIKEKAKEIKEKGECPSIEEASLLDVKAGRVSILAVSRDESTLAAAVDHSIFLYSILSLLDKEQEPSFSCSLNESGIVKDLKWQNNVGKSFVVLSSDGSLYKGMLEDELKNVMDNVDAVDWSAEGSFLAVARKGIITIFSSNFKEILSMSLFFESWPPINAEYTVKVDTIKWLRDDSIVIGCLQVNEDGEEEGYLVQVIKSKGHNFSEVNCNPVVYSFPDPFDAVWNILPFGCGPYLVANYLDYWEVVLASNQKAIDQHISLFKWSVEDHRREVVSLEFRSDKYTPKIEVPENGDDNLLLGFCVEKFYSNEKIKIQVDDQFKEISPRCTLLCLTSEGKLNLFHAARITDRLDLLQTFVATDSNHIVKEMSFTRSVSEAPTTIPRLKDDDIEDTRSGNQLKRISTGELDDQKGFSSSKATQSKEYSSSSPSTVNAETLHTFPGPRALTQEGSLGGKSNFSREQQLLENTRTSKYTQSKEYSSSSPSTVNAETLHTFPGPRTLTQEGSLGGKSNFSRVPQLLENTRTSKYTQSKEYSSSSPSTANAETLHTFPGPRTLTQEGSLGGNFSRVQQLLENTRTSKYTQTLDSESEMSNQFYNVNNMAQELDNLLAFIEKKGGFRDACTVHQRGSLLALENELGDLSEIAHKCKKDVEEQLMQIQQLQNKMLQVSARHVYMKVRTVGAAQMVGSA